MGSTVVAEVKSTDQATRVVGSASIADRQSSDQVTQLASNQISAEVLEVIEAIPHHEFFIPRALRSWVPRFKEVVKSQLTHV